MADWAFHSIQLTTGEVVLDLPLVDFQGTISLLGGAFSARLPLAHLDVVTQQQLVEFTAPGRYSIVGVRDGIVQGEWIIWKRVRGSGYSPIEISGSEVVSLLNHRLMQAWSWTQVDQMTIAAALVTMGFSGDGQGGGVAVSVPAPTLSGQLRDRTYVKADGDIGTRLRELSDVENGFDYLIRPQWATDGRAKITRTATFHYPQAGTEQELIFELAGVGDNAVGNILAISVAEDATKLASRTTAIGGQLNDATLLGTYTNTAQVVAGFPFLERVQSWSTVTTQATINDYARSLWLDSQHELVPSGASVLADAFPTVGDYSLGDRITLQIETTPSFPSGYSDRARIIAWTFHQVDEGPALIDITFAEDE